MAKKIKEKKLKDIFHPNQREIEMYEASYLFNLEYNNFTRVPHNGMIVMSFTVTPLTPLFTVNASLIELACCLQHDNIPIDCRGTVNGIYMSEKHG